MNKKLKITVYQVQSTNLQVQEDKITHDTFLDEADAHEFCTERLKNLDAKDITYAPKNTLQVFGRSIDYSNYYNSYHYHSHFGDYHCALLIVPISIY